MKERATIADVATLAGVSTASVSRVLTNKGASNSLRKKVEEAADQLGYTPRKSTSSQASVDKKGVAVLTGDLLNPFFPQVIRGIQDEIENYEGVLSLYSLTTHPIKRALLLDRIKDQKHSGVILMGTTPFPELITLQEELEIPVVSLNHCVNRKGFHSIIINFESAVKKAADHLITLGHKKIGYLDAYGQSDISLARKRGLLSSLDEAGLELAPECVSTILSGTEAQGGFQAMERLLNLPKEARPTGIIAFNDVVAIGALHAAYSHQFVVPRDLSIIGFDDISIAPHTIPPLTTISQPKYKMGVTAVQTIMQMRTEVSLKEDSCMVLESPLVIRESTGAPPE